MLNNDTNSTFPEGVKIEEKRSGHPQFLIIMAKKEFSDDLRQCLVPAHSEGKGYKAISKQYDVPMATVQSIINKHKRVNTVKYLSWCGRKRKVSPKLARKICQEVNNNPRITTKALIETLDQAGTKVSRSTIERARIVCFSFLPPDVFNIHMAK